MSSLASCDLWSVEQVSLTLSECGDLAADAEAACGRAAEVTGRWRGPAARAFDECVLGVRRRLASIRSAHHAAGEALGRYALELAEAAELARRADTLTAEADRLSGPFRQQVASAAGVPVCGPDPGQATRSAAARLLHEAMEREAAAAAMAAARLDELAGSAPPAPWSAGPMRFMGDAAGALVGSVVDLGRLALLTGEAIGARSRGREARSELWETAKATVRVWEPVQQMWLDLWGGRPGSAVGAAVAMVLTRKQKLALRTRILDQHLAYREALREDALRTALASVVITRPSAAVMARDGVSLLNEEKRGGHTIAQHVGAATGYLLHRLTLRGQRASTFRDLATAEQLIGAVLRQHAHRLAEAAILGPGQQIVLRSDFAATTGRVSVAGSRRLLTGRKVVVVLRSEGGQPHVYTAYPDL